MTASAARNPLGWAAWLRRALPTADPYPFFLLVIPVLVLSRNVSFLFPPAGYIDPWVYTGFMHNLVPFKQDLFQNTYYGSRLPEILPGYVISRVFSPLATNCILHLAFYYVAVVSLYYILKYSVGRKTGLLAAVVFGFHPYLWVAVGWDYPDGAGIAYYLLTLAFLTAAGCGRRRAAMLGLAGASYAAMFYCNLTWAYFSLSFPLYYLYLARTRQKLTLRSGLVQWAVWFAVGAASLTIVLGIVNHAIDGHFWFYLPSIVFALDMAGRPNPWKAESFAWAWTARWMLPAAMTVLLGLTYAVRTRRVWKCEPGRAANVFFVNFAVTCVIMIFLELRGFPCLQHPYYASLLIPSTFLVVGAEACHVAEGIRPRTFLVLLCLAVILLAVPWLDVSASIWRHVLSRTGSAAVLGLSGMALAGAVALRSRAAGVVACMMGLALLDTYAKACDPAVARLPLHESRNAFVRITQGMRMIEQDRQGRQVRFWYDTNEPQGNEFTSLNSIYLWAYTWIGLSFPALSEERPLSPGTLVVVPSARTSAVEDAGRGFHRKGLMLTLEAQRQIKYGGVGYGLYFFNLRAEPPPSAAPGSAR